MIKLNGFQGSTMPQIQKESEKLATDLNTNFKQVINNQLDIATINTDIADINTDISTINSTITTMQGVDVTLANAISTLQNDQYYNVNDNIVDSNYSVSNNKIFIAYESLTIANGITFTIESGSTLIIDITLYNKEDRYLLSEIKTNQTWIDGRPIYRKVINFGAMPNATVKGVVHNIPEASTSSASSFRFVRLIGYGLYPNNYYVHVPWFNNSGTTFWFGILYADATYCYMSANVNLSYISEVYVIMEYVK